MRRVGAVLSAHLETNPVHVIASRKDQRQACPCRWSGGAAEIRSKHCSQSPNRSILTLRDISNPYAHEQHLLLADQITLHAHCITLTNAKRKARFCWLTPSRIQFHELFILVDG